MKSTAKTLALGAALLCLLAGGMALPASAFEKFLHIWIKYVRCGAPARHRRVAALEQRQQRAC